MKATIKLFKALPVQNKDRKRFASGPRFRLGLQALLLKTIPRGFIYSPEVVSSYSEQELLDMAKEIGRTSEQLNSSFHKSWKKVKEADIVQLVLEQMIHYFTTYGFESLGIYDKDSVYIPNEYLNVPNVKIDSLNLVVIRGYTKEELKEKVLKMLSSAVALKEDTLNSIVEIGIFTGISLDDLRKVKNREVRIKLYDYLDVLPKDPLEFLRFLLYQTTNETLLIKNKELIEKISTADNLKVLVLFTKYKERYGLEKLATIFNRFKPLFLAFKSGQVSLIINKISKLSKKYHKPMPVDYLNEITSMIKKGEGISLGQLEFELSNANTFRKIRLAYALKYRTKDASSILYKIRNGKSWATEISYNELIKARSGAVLTVVLKSIVDDISKRVGYKKIYLPKNIGYALPATEKQFTGNFPSGTYVAMDKNMVFGVHWFNLSEKYKTGKAGLDTSWNQTGRVDLDLSFITTDGKKYGWDGDYRSVMRGILFSGDVTDAPRPLGASELFYLQAGFLDCPGVLMVNYYNLGNSLVGAQEVPFEIVVGKRNPKKFDADYIIDPNDIVCSAGAKIERKQKILGVVVPVEEGLRFYFSETYIGKSITSRNSLGVNDARQYLVDFYTDTLSLNELLLQSSAKIVEKEEECDISLSPEKLEKDTILNLFVAGSFEGHNPSVPWSGCQACIDENLI